MSNQYQNVTPSSREGDNIFDKYFTLIERFKLASSKKIIRSYVILENSIQLIERNLRDLADQGESDNSQITLSNSLIDSVLNDWIPILTHFKKNNDFIDAFSYNLIGLAMSINERIEEQKKDFLISYFSPCISYDFIKSIDNHKYFNSISHQLNTPSENSYLPLSLYKKMFAILEKEPLINENINFKIIKRQQDNCFNVNLDYVSGNDIEKLRSSLKGKDLISLIERHEFESSKFVNSEWIIEIRTEQEHPEAVKFFKFLYDFSSIISLIDLDNIEVNIEDWGKGSMWAKIRVTFKDFLAKEETKQILDKAREAALAEVFDKRIGEARKLEAEVRKIDKENDNLPSKHIIDEKHQLEVEEKRLDNISKVIAIESQMIDLQLKKIEAYSKVSELAKNCFLEINSNIQVKMNEQLYMIFDKKLESGVDMNVISGREEIKPKTDNLAEEGSGSGGI